MNFNQANELHNGDQIIVKATNEVTKVINTELENKNIWIYATTNGGYARLRHTEVI